jgi:hypothetical protein
VLADGMSAKALQGALGIGSYQGAWTLLDAQVAV